MKLIRKLASVLCLASLCLSYSASIDAQDLIPGQIYNTGNVVVPTNYGGPSSWVNGVYQDNITCWAAGNPGYCGPNPIIRPGNNVNFSYGSTYIYQEQPANTLIPGSTTGIQIDGFNFGFRAKNGNGWDDGRMDQLSAVVRFWDTTGSKGPTNILEKYDYNLTYKFDWTNFNMSETFATPRDITTIGKVQYGFIGKDNNNWAGPYGPEVTNISFSLKYSIDPCVSNPISSPTCPGYLQAINRFTSPTSISNVVESVSPISTTSNLVTPVFTTSTTGIIVDTPIVNTTVSSSTSVTSSTTTATTSTSNSVTPSATNPQPRVGEVIVSGSPPQTTSSQSTNISQALSIIRSEQNRVSRLEMSTASAAVEQAKQESEKTVTEATAVATAQQTQSVASSDSSSAVALGGSAQSLGSGLQVSVANVLQFSNIGRDSAFNTLPMGPQSSAAMGAGPSVSYAFTPSTTAASAASAVSTVPTSSFAQRQQIEEAVNQQNTESTSAASTLNPTNPLNSFVNPTAISNENVQQNTGPAVNRNAQSNTAAGGSDITVIATAPPGFDAYQNGRLPDGAFYAPREIYRNQRPVDNARVQRALSGGSDRLHQEMINQQYQGLGQ